MGFYVKLQKVAEDESSARYSFETDPAQVGVLELEKSTGELKLIQAMPNDEGSRCYTRAAVKVKREWAEGRLPDILEWAS